MKSFKNPDDAIDFAVSSLFFPSLNFSAFLCSTECQTSTFFSVISLRMSFLTNILEDVYIGALGHNNSKRTVLIYCIVSFSSN